MAIGAYLAYKGLKKQPLGASYGKIGQKSTCIPIVAMDTIENAQIADKFGAATHLVFILPNKKPTIMSVENAKTGIDIAKAIISEGTSVVLVGSVGDRVKKFLEENGVQVKTGYKGKVENYL